MFLPDFHLKSQPWLSLSPEAFRLAEPLHAVFMFLLGAQGEYDARSAPQPPLQPGKTADRTCRLTSLQRVLCVDLALLRQNVQVTFITECTVTVLRQNVQVNFITECTVCRPSIVETKRAG